MIEHWKNEVRKFKGIHLLPSIS